MTLLSEVDSSVFSRIAFVLTDIDDTLTRDGVLENEAYDAIWRLYESGLQIIPVTGRPAGWCDCIARQWPVAGVVGENGAFAFYRVNGVLKHLYHPETKGRDSEGALRSLAEDVIRKIPGTRIAKDQFARKFDVAIDFREEEPKLDYSVAEDIRALCRRAGAQAKVSSIHVNAWFGEYDKLSMAREFLSNVHGLDIDRAPDSVIFCGDSPNDEPMFARFAHSAAVANIEPFLGALESKPRYLCTRSHGGGFSELADKILDGKGSVRPS
jgi:hypothetical protein